MGNICQSMRQTAKAKVIIRGYSLANLIIFLKYDFWSFLILTFGHFWDMIHTENDQQSLNEILWYRNVGKDG